MEPKTWHFVDRYTGEEFFVESPWIRGARAIAEKYFDFPVCLGLVDLETAEAMGLDTYWNSNIKEVKYFFLILYFSYVLRTKKVLTKQFQKSYNVGNKGGQKNV